MFLLAQTAGQLDHLTRSVKHIETVVAGDTVDDHVKTLATMASLALALLVLFTTRRSQVLRDDEESGLGQLNWSAALTDVALTCATVLCLVAMWSVFTDSFSIADWADSDHALRSMFSVIWIGFLVLAATQLTLVGRQVLAAAGNRRAARRAVGEKPPAGAPSASGVSIASMDCTMARSSSSVQAIFSDAATSGTS